MKLKVVAFNYFYAVFEGPPSVIQRTDYLLLGDVYFSTEIL